MIVAGNGTVPAAKALGWKSIDVVRTKLRGAEARAFAIADNRTAELAEWDAEELRKQLDELEADGFDVVADLISLRPRAHIRSCRWCNGG